MFEQPGIGLDDLAWIQRDQFVHYVTIAGLTSDPHDWPRLRDDLLGALTAAFGLDIDDPDSNGTPEPILTSRQQRTFGLLDDTRARHDPATDWPGFFDALWEGRRRLRADL